MQKQVLTSKSKVLGFRGMAAFLLGILFCADLAQTQQTPPRDLTTTSIEDLMNVEVTSVSRKEQKLANTAAVIF